MNRHTSPQHQPATASELAEELGTDERGLWILLNALATLGLLEKRRNHLRIVANELDSRVLLIRGAGVETGDKLLAGKCDPYVEQEFWLEYSKVAHDADDDYLRDLVVADAKLLREFPEGGAEDVVRSVFEFVIGFQKSAEGVKEPGVKRDARRPSAQCQLSIARDDRRADPDRVSQAVRTDLERRIGVMQIRAREFAIARRSELQVQRIGLHLNARKPSEFPVVE